jgi:hypothetical protein
LTIDDSSFAFEATFLWTGFTGAFGSETVLEAVRTARPGTGTVLIGPKGFFGGVEVRFLTKPLPLADVLGVEGGMRICLRSAMALRARSWIAVLEDPSLVKYAWNTWRSRVVATSSAL